MQRLLYLLLYPILWLTSILPLRILYIKSTFLFFIVYYLVGYRKKVVKNNLKLVFPEKSSAEINSIAKKFFQHLCDIIFETIKSLTISENEIKKRFVYKNLEVIEELYKKDKSILLMCGHYASWEWSGILMKQTNYKGFGVYKKLDNPYFDKLVRKIRERFGGNIINNKQIVKTLYKEFKKNNKTITLILSDQTPKPWAYKDRQLFMGIDVPVFTGTEEMAKMLDFATVYLKIEKVKRGYYEATFVPLAENPKEYKDYEITRMFLTQVENQIKNNPPYYLWSHKRWKHRN
ncbi:lysophospholipid acyltransferase family protein [Aureisphaera sp. CAU 1614]|uniref:Lysophospholipid acyltransferase family protein n=1 Tax=Halomarinibacterium sedimenti TaxID=2857106 RepID=A0A9X1JZM4_9FLAO|nr:lysophospholipid acyltransferase family protein [Halomarinibacterium sedimenti]MBW2937456.1 lysophospholipid acyltransferase family protein [Halomarinibacterium sedimenti]